MTTTAVLPAYNEAKTVGDVVDAAEGANLVDHVLVVDNGSTDDTGRVAKEHGAEVIFHPQGGKGEAMAAGVAATAAGLLVFLDTDLTGLRPTHVDKLVAAVTVGGADMSSGLVDRGSAKNWFILNLLPRLNGQRALRRELFESLSLEDIAGYRVEAALNSRARELGLTVEQFVLDGVFHRTKEEKLDSSAQGWAKKVGMLATAMGAYVAYWTIRRRRQGQSGVEEHINEAIEDTVGDTVDDAVSETVTNEGAG